jgi:hypothetical protein
MQKTAKSRKKRKIINSLKKYSTNEELALQKASFELNLSSLFYMPGIHVHASKEMRTNAPF